MKRKNRIFGTLVSLVLLSLSIVLMTIPELHETALLIIMFVGGYMLRETIDGEMVEE